MARTFVSQILESTGAFSLVLGLRRVGPPPWLTVLTYHRVAQPVPASELDDGVIDVRPEVFDRQLRFLKRHCNVIAMEDLLEFRHGRALPPNPVLITFDDGYRDNHDTALPILTRHGLKAVFFIATSYVNDRRLFWWDRVNYLVKRSTREVLDVDYPRKTSFALGTTPAARALAVRQVLAIIKSHFGLDLPRYLEAIEQGSGVVLSADYEARAAGELLMSWEHVRALKRAGMSIESHTRTHRVLHTLSTRELRDELAGSREELEAIIGDRVSAVAYPVGRGLSCAPDARSAIRAAGYQLGFSNGTGINALWRFDPLDVKRLSLELDLPDAYFHGMVAIPYFAYELHAPARASHA